MGWENDSYVQKTKEQNARDLKGARDAYAAVANERLNNIAHGESANPIFSPWLAMKQAAVNNLQLMPAERAAPNAQTSGYFTPGSDARDAEWEQAVKGAQALAAQGGGKPKLFQP